ncbi:gamma-glutamyltransferase [Bradyrhizobium genosp. P]|uniref:gamma-glutamyltransferase n=1 Tax=Bradyrhizobium genosp. P TaxID=83641 RepID=UPI003CF0FA57
MVEPYNSSLAGLGVAICWIASEQSARVLNFVPPPPRSFQCPDEGDRVKLRRGGAGSGLPACLSGWSELVENYGKGSLADALEPARRLARDGVSIG